MAQRRQFLLHFFNKACLKNLEKLVVVVVVVVATNTCHSGYQQYLCSFIEMTERLAKLDANLFRTKRLDNQFRLGVVHKVCQARWGGRYRAARVTI